MSDKGSDKDSEKENDLEKSLKALTDGNIQQDAKNANKTKKPEPATPPTAAAPAEPKTAPPVLTHRKDIRRIVHERCPIILFSTEADADKELTIGLVVDISPKGAGFLVAEQLKPGMKVIVELRGQRYQHRIQALVVWCGELPSSGKVIKLGRPLKWRMGVCFQLKSSEEEESVRIVAESL